ncbi:uncharacterized protein METZ01_LOCUS278358, partial [marine metagenome]
RPMNIGTILLIRRDSIRISQT